MSCGAMLKTLRGNRSQEAVAKDIGITKSSWAMYERNERTPRDEIKIRIADYFGRTVQEIFFGHNEHI
ncbi:MAG: helix-turn-helix transcriptional regulator [Clostridia bacterium]|nr:helix-turn-helix transcriptional regulator [Clostridia bacterium]